MTTVVRADCARGIAELIRELGGDPAALLAKADLSLAAVVQPHALIPHRALVHVLERAAQELDCPDFGLRLAARQDIGVLGPLAVAVSNAPTVGEALGCASKYLYTHAPAVQFEVAPLPDSSRVMLKVELLLDRLPNRRQVSEHHLGQLHQILAMLSEGRCRPLAATFRHRPAVARQAHFQFFGAPVRFEAADDALIVTREDLEQPINGRDQQLQDIAASYLETSFPAPCGRLVAQIRVLAERLLQAGRCTQAEAAAALGLKVRTLQRRLQEEGADFEGVRDAARREMALRYLAQRNVSVSQISAMLGYAEPSTFTRSCRRWFGLSPREVRNRAGELDWKDAG